MIWTIKLLKQGFPAVLFSLAVMLAIFQPFPLPAAAISARTLQLFPFHQGSGTYVFGLDDCLPGAISKLGQVYCKTNDNAANWWRINDDPKKGFSPALTRAKMSSNYKAVTSFELNNHPYIFGLHTKVGANIWRINDDPCTGFKLVMYRGKMSHSYKHVVSFQLRGEPYILGLHTKVGANIWRIKEGPKGLTFDLIKDKAKMSPRYEHLAVFYMGGHPYIFGLHEGVGANIWRIKDDPSQGYDLIKYGARFPHSYNFVLPFHVGGRPYLLGVASQNDYKEWMEAVSPGLQEGGVWANLTDAILQTAGTGAVEWGKGYGCIWEIVSESNGLSIKKVTKKCVPISHRYAIVTMFEHAGKAYIFGVHEEHYANIWRINDDPSTGFTLDYYGRH